MSYEFTDYLTESSLSKLLRKSDDSRCAILTAFRGSIKKQTKEEKDEEAKNPSGKKQYYTKQENNIRNSQLAALLAKKGLSYTQVQGGYVEVDKDGNETPVKELSFFVQNTSLTDAEFDKFIYRLGFKFEQDSVLIIPKGGKEAFIWGTSENSKYIALNQKIKVGDATYGNIKTQYFSKIGGRGFEFVSLTESVDYDIKVTNPETSGGHYAKHLNLEQNLKELETIEVDLESNIE